MIPKIWKALPNDHYREVMTHCLIKKNHTVASDSYILVKHQTIDLFPESFIKTLPAEGIYVDAFGMKELAKKTASDVELLGDWLRIAHVDKTKTWYVEVKISQVDFSELGKYPDYESVIPKLKEDLGPQEKVKFNPMLMNNLKEAMGAHKHLIFYFNKNVTGVTFVKSDNEDYQAIGLIMGGVFLENE